MCSVRHCFVLVSGTLPGRIFIYRDGVGDGQIPYVHTHEVSTFCIMQNPLNIACALLFKNVNNIKLVSD